MKIHGFSVLNQGRIQRDHGYYLLNTQIIGLDSDREIIEFVSFLGRDGLYSVGLRSRPPTRRSPELEEAALTFASNSLGCEVRNVTRGENGPDAIAFYNREVQRVRSLFREAEELQKQ